MRYLEVGGARVSRIGLGTWQFGAQEWGYGEQYAQHTAGALVRRALDLGINLIDSAEIYAFGRSEKIVGAALAGRRAQAFIATKVFPVLPVPAYVAWRGRASARRLRISQIDLYQLHWPQPVVPLRSQMAGMRRLLQEGVIRHVGVSNYSLERWRAAEAALGGAVLSNQVQFSLLDLRPLRELVPFAAREGRIVIAYSPLAQGLLSGRYDGSVKPVGRMRRLNPRFQHPELTARLAGVLRQVGDRHGATAAQVALAWIVRQPNTVAIPGASTLDQLEQNAAAADLELDDAEAERIFSSAFSPG